VLLSRIASGELDRAPIWDDVTSLRGTMLPSIDIIFGGFPCQDISVAGSGAGLAGERSGLYSHIERLIRETKPTFVFLENVPAIRTRGLGRVVWGLASLGYDLRWTVISAASVGAPHKRDRWFCFASNTNRIELRDESRRRVGKKWKGAAIVGNDGEKESVANAAGERRFERDQNSEWGSCRNCEKTPERGGSSGGDRRWSPEPDVCRVVDGLPYRVDRVKCLGNSVVPKQAREAFKILSGIGGIA